MEFQPTVHERGYRERDAEQNRLDYLREDYYSHDIAANEFYDASTTHNIVSNVTVLYFTNGAAQSADASFVKPGLWRNGELRITYWWSTNGTDTNAFDVEFNIWGLKSGSAMGAKTVLNNTNQTPTPGGTGFRLAKSTFTCTGTVVNEHEIIAIQIKRNGNTDANNDNFFLLGVNFKFLPNSRQ